MRLIITLALIGGLATGICPEIADAQTTPVKKVEQTVKKVKNKVVRNARRATRSTNRGLKTATQQAALYSEAALTNIPTPAWNKLQSAYETPAGPPKVEEFPKDHSTAIMIKLRFTGVNNKPVEGTFLRPKAEGVYPCALVLHGLTNNKEIALKMFGDMLLAHNIAILALDAPEHGAQRKPDKNMWSRDVITVAVRHGTRNYRRMLDWLETRKDVDSSRIGLVGYSMGSIMGSILGAVDNRVSAFALCVGGDPFRVLARLQPVAQRDAVLFVSPSLYVEHITPRPMAFFNGRKDVVVVPPAAMLLHNAAKEPKQIVWYDGGHDVPASIRKQAVDWLAAKLAPDAAAGEAPKPAPEAAPKPGGK